MPNGHWEIEALWVGRASKDKAWSLPPGWEPIGCEIRSDMLVVFVRRFVEEAE